MVELNITFYIYIFDSDCSQQKYSQNLKFGERCIGIIMIQGNDIPTPTDRFFVQKTRILLGLRICFLTIPHKASIF